MLAIVLARRNFREFDQLITVYTAETGKREALARGVKKIISKNAPFLEPFSLITVDIIPGRGIDHLITAQSSHLFKNIRSDWEKIMMAGYAVGLVDQLIEEGEKDEQLFELLRSWLVYLDQTTVITRSGQTTPLTTLDQSMTAATMTAATIPDQSHTATTVMSGALLTAFMLKLLDRLGFTPVSDRCVIGGEEKKSADYYFDSARGGLVCLLCAKVSKSMEVSSSIDSLLLNQTSADSIFLNQTSADALHLLPSIDWSKVDQLLGDNCSADQVQKAVYQFAVYHTGKKIPSPSFVHFN